MIFSKLLFGTITNIVLLVLTTIYSYSQSGYEIIGDYSVGLFGDWAYNTEKSSNSYYTFGYITGEISIRIPKNPQICENLTDYNSKILQITQKLNNNQEFAELTKPSLPCVFLRQDRCYMLKIKSRLSDNRRFLLYHLVGKNIYEIEIQETNPGNQPNEVAMHFLANIYLTSEQANRNIGKNINSEANQRDVPLKDEQLSKYKKVKEYNSVSQNSDGETLKVETRDAIFQVHKTALPSGKELSITSIPADFKVFDEMITKEQITQIAKDNKVLRAYEIGPNGQLFDSPAKIDIVISDSDLPKGKSLNDLEVLLVSDGEFEALPFEKTEKGIAIKIHHCSSLLIFVTVGGVGLISALTMSMKVQSEPIERADCAKWIDPNNQKIKEIAADSKRFNINSKGDIYLDLGKKMKGMNVGQGNHFLKPKQFIEKPEGDCVNFSSLYGSFLAAKGYPIRVVAGNAKYPTYSGGHQWIETVIDGRIYYVDTFSPNKAKLVPIEVARKLYKLEAGKMCYPESPKKYIDDWYKDLLKDHDIYVNRYKELQAEHRVLQEFCVAGIESSCKDATYIYKEAMVLRRELESKGIKVID